jgi:hypothetical protein
VVVVVVVVVVVLIRWQCCDSFACSAAAVSCMEFGNSLFKGYGVLRARGKGRWMMARSSVYCCLVAVMLSP